jgi:hypothetical protein
MTTYWHIADASYDGGDLLCRNELADEDRAPEWAWGDDAPEGYDGDVVCLFTDTEQGRTEADWLWYERKDGVLLRIEVPKGTRIVSVAEGYPAILGRIPAEWIIEVRRGYADGAIR